MVRSPLALTHPTNAMLPEIVELMATSNNVINVGFVPQDDKDSAELFGRAVTCTPRPASTYAIHSSVFSKGQSGKTTVYAVCVVCRNADGEADGCWL